MTKGMIAFVLKNKYIKNKLLTRIFCLWLLATGNNVKILGAALCNPRPLQTATTICIYLLFLEHFPHLFSPPKTAGISSTHQKWTEMIYYSTSLTRCRPGLIWIHKWIDNHFPPPPSSLVENGCMGSTSLASSSPVMGLKSSKMDVKDLTGVSQERLDVRAFMSPSGMENGSTTCLSPNHSRSSHGKRVVLESIRIPRFSHQMPVGTNGNCLSRLDTWWMAG